MNNTMPSISEYAPYYESYVRLVAGNIIDVLEGQAASFPYYLRAIPDQYSDYAYASGKWTVKQATGHIIDTERIMAYRALRVARNDQTPLPGFDENKFANENRVEHRTLDELAMEFAIVRTGNVFIFKSLTEAELKRGGIASENPVTVRALMYIMAGHLQHHLNIFEQRYFPDKEVLNFGK